MSCFAVFIVSIVLAFAFQQTPEPTYAQLLEQDHHVTSVAARKAAVDSLQSTVEQLRTSGRLSEAAQTLNRVGHFQIRMSQTDDAVKTFQDALKLVDEQANPNIHIDSLNGVATSYAQLSKCDLAEPSANDALTVSKQHNYIAGQARALLTISDCQNYRDHALAVKTAEESLALWQSIAVKRGMADTHVAIGHYQMAQHNLTECGQSFKTALDLFKELDDKVEQADVLIYFGYIEYRNGAWQSALAYYTQAEAMLDKEAEPYKMGRLTIGVGDSFLESGMPEVALPKYQESLDYFRITKNRRAMSILKWAIGKAHYFSGEYEQAITSLQTARGEADSNRDTTLTAFCDDFLGRTYSAQGNYGPAVSHFQSAFDGYTKAKNKREAARVQALLGQVAQQKGDLEGARKNYELALKTFSELSDRVNESATLFAIGKLELSKNNLTVAEDYLHRSIQATENLRRNASSSDLTIAFSAAVYDRYQSYIDCLMREERSSPGKNFGTRAFEMSEFARARSLKELLQGTEANLAPGVDPNLMDQERTIRHERRVKEDYRVRLLAGDYKQEELTSLEAKLAELDAKHDQIVAAIQTQYPAYKQITSPVALSLNDIQQKLLADDQSVLLEYSLGKEKSYVWAVTRDRFTSYELPGESQIVDKAETLYRLLTADPKPNAGDLEKAQRELSEMVLAPVKAELNKQRIILVADGALNYVAFQLLPYAADDSTPLVAKYEIVNTPSASILGGLNQELSSHQRDKLLAVFGDPNLPTPTTNNGDGTSDNVSRADENERRQQGLRDIQFNPDTSERSEVQPLFHVKRELANLRELTDEGDRLVATGDDATRERLLSTDLTHYAILHFATHGVLDARRPQNSGLILSTVTSDGKAQNGFVSLEDIYQLRTPVNLVVLSACQTGLGKDVRGEGLIGLTRGFMYAGASSVVASLWKVDDEATAELMKRFYTNMLHNGMPPAAALRAAQNSIRQEPQWRSPYYWAAFTLQGDFRQTIKPVGRTSAYSTTLLAGVLASVIAGGGLFYFIRRKRRLG